MKEIPLIPCRAASGKMKGQGYCTCSGTCADDKTLSPIDDVKQEAMNKTKVKITGNDPHNDFKIGDTGVVDGYMGAPNWGAFAVVILDKDARFVMVPLNDLEYKKPMSMQEFDEHLKKAVTTSASINDKSEEE